tara:strand:+ start:256 stop:453 length:198 start_codon:yes stop_codon:yes gene_type:complete
MKPRWTLKYRSDQVSPWEDWVLFEGSDKKRKVKAYLKKKEEEYREINPKFEFKIIETPIKQRRKK